MAGILRISEIAQRITRNTGQAHRVLSVDLFDTLLLRTTTPEPQRLRAIAELWASHQMCREIGLTVDGILEARLQCAKIAYRVAESRDGVREATILEVLSLQLHTLRLPLEILPSVLELELSYEEGALQPNTAVAQLCQEARASGYRILVISDMYLGKDHLKRLLDTHGLGTLVDDIYVSSSIGITKRSGKLFQHVLGKEGIHASAMLHVGDHYHSDHRVPKEMGIDAHWLPRPMIWRMSAAVRANAYLWRHPDLRLL